MRPRSRIQTTGPNNGHQLRDYSKSSNRSENRPLIYDGIIEGAHYRTSNDRNRGHSISDFVSYISQLPEGNYIVINGQIVKK